MCSDNSHKDIFCKIGAEFVTRGGMLLARSYEGKQCRSVVTRTGNIARNTDKGFGTGGEGNTFWATVS